MIRIGLSEAGGTAIDRNLQCKSNSPRPTGGKDRVHGNKEDQCPRLWVDGWAFTVGPAGRGREQGTIVDRSRRSSSASTPPAPRG